MPTTLTQPRRSRRPKSKLKRRLRSPINWFGGKGNIVAKLLPLIPRHTTYVEPFGGGAAVLFAKAPSPVETYNDVHGGVVNLFRVLRSPRKAVALRRKLRYTPYSRAERAACLGLWRDAKRSDVQRAWAFFVEMRQGFAGKVDSTSWGYVCSQTAGGKAKTVNSWLGAIPMLAANTDRLRDVQIDGRDFRLIFKCLDRPETFFYCDPPYSHSTRRGGAYPNELTDDDHRELVDLLLDLDGMAMLSGYCNPIYKPLEAAGWQRKTFRTACHIAGRTRTTGILGKGAALRKVPRTECVWLCPRTQQRLKRGEIHGLDQTN